MEKSSGMYAFRHNSVLLTTKYIGMKGPLPYNYFSEVDWAFHQDSWMGQVLDDCDWEWVLKDFAKDDMFCGNDSMFFLIVICVLCQHPLPILKCCLSFDLWVTSPRLWWMACTWWICKWCLEWHLYLLWGSLWVHCLFTIVFFHSFHAPEQSQVFIHNFDVLHQ